MPRKNQELNRADELLDDLLATVKAQKRASESPAYSSSSPNSNGR